MEDHATISVFSCQRFGVFDQGLADSLPLQFRDNGYLPHPNVATFKGPKHKASHQPIATIAGNVERVLFGIQFFSGELETQGPSQDRIPEIDRRPVFGGTVFDLAEFQMFVHSIFSFQDRFPIRSSPNQARHQRPHAHRPIGSFPKSWRLGYRASAAQESCPPGSDPIGRRPSTSGS